MSETEQAGERWRWVELPFGAFRELETWDEPNSDGQEWWSQGQVTIYGAERIDATLNALEAELQALREALERISQRAHRIIDGEIDTLAMVASLYTAEVADNALTVAQQDKGVQG